MKQLNHPKQGLTELKGEGWLWETLKDVCTDKIFILSKTNYFSSRISVLLEVNI